MGRCQDSEKSPSVNSPSTMVISDAYILSNSPSTIWIRGIHTLLGVVRIRRT